MLLKAGIPAFRYGHHAAKMRPQLLKTELLFGRRRQYQVFQAEYFGLTAPAGGCPMMNRIVDQPVFFRKAVAKMRNQKRQYLVFRMNHGCQISVLIRKPQEGAVSK